MEFVPGIGGENACEVNSSFEPTLELPANLSGLWIKPSYGNCFVNKKAGRKDKHGAETCFIVGKSKQWKN